MKNRFIAALMLATLALWSVPGAWAASTSSATPTTDHAAAASGQDHSCCPRVQSRFVPPVFVKPGPASMPCGDQHPCCAKQGPENPPSLPATSKLTRPGSHGVLVAIAEQLGHDATVFVTLASERNPLRSYSARSSVRRI